MVALGDQDKKATERLYGLLYENVIDDILIADLPFKSLLQDKILHR